MFPHGLKGFSMPMKPLAVEPKQDVKHLASALQCQMGDAVYTVGKAPDPKPKPVWSEAEKQTGNMGGAPLKL
jgi:hypothetical protein